MAVFDQTGPGGDAPIPITQADRDYTAKQRPIQSLVALPGVPGMPQSLSELVPGGAIPNAVTRHIARHGPSVTTGRFGLPAFAVPAEPLSPVQAALPPVDPAANSMPPTAEDIEIARRRAAAYFALGSNIQGSPLSLLSSAFAAPQPVQQPQQSLMPRPLNAPIYDRLS